MVTYKHKSGVTHGVHVNNLRFTICGVYMGSERVVFDTDITKIDCVACKAKAKLPKETDNVNN